MPSLVVLGQDVVSLAFFWSYTVQVVEHIDLIYKNCHHECFPEFKQVDYTSMRGVFQFLHFQHNNLMCLRNTIKC